MHCVKAPRELRKKPAGVDCWGNVSLFTDIQARACGFLQNVTLCKKHFDEKINENKLKCCFPLHSDNECSGSFVSCPRRLFAVFDSFQHHSHIGTFICEKHLLLADRDERICNSEGYTPPKKVFNYVN